MKPLTDTQSLIEHIPVAICIRHLRDGKWKYNYCNSLWYKLTKTTPEKAIGFDLYQMMVNSDYPSFHARSIADISDKTDAELLNGKTEPYEASISYYDYSYIRIYKHVVRVDGEDCILAAIFDISDRVKAEEMKDRLQESLLSSSKMTLIGEFSAGLSHEINNPMQVMILDLEELEDKVFSCTKCQMEDDDDCQKCFKCIKQLISSVRLSIDIINNIIYSIQDHVSTFHKKSSEEYLVRNIIEDSLNILRYKNIRHRINVIDETKDCNCTVFCCKADLVQVFINLLVNAMDAVKHLEFKKRIVKISCRQGEDNTTYIFFEDVGKGVPKEIEDKMFEPFVTTKRAASDDKLKQKTGIGLGLSISRQLISYNAGSIKYKRVGRLTQFVCSLPSKRFSREKELEFKNE